MMQKRTILKLLMSVFVLISMHEMQAQNHFLSFSGSSSDAVVIPDDTDLDIYNEITLEAWIYAHSWRNQIHEGTVIGKEKNNGSGYILRTGNGGNLQLNLGIAGNWVDAVTTGAPLQAGTWHHVAGTFDGDSLIVFIDGVQAAYTLQTGTIDTNDQTVEIGRLTQYNDRYFDGYIDEVRVWNKALSESTINAWKNGVTTSHPDYSNLVAYYPMEDHTTSTVLADDANTHNGSIIGNVVYLSGSFTCAATGINVQNITTTSARFTWDDVGAMSYELEYGLNNFTPGSGTSVLGTDTFEDINTFLASTKYDVYVRAICSAGDTSAWSMDSLTTVALCPAVTGIGTTSVLPDSATFSFTSTGTSFNYEWGPVGFGQGTGTSGTGNSNPLGVGGLAPGQCYDIYIQNNCTGAGNGTSTWTGPYTFCTPCLTQSLPYTENFDAGFGCFVALDSGATTDTWFNAPTGGTPNVGNNDLNGSPYMLVDSDDAGSVNMDEYLVSPAIDASGISGLLILEFDQYFNYIGGEKADVDVYDGTQWVNILNQTTDVGSWANPDHQFIDVTAYANANFQVRFHYYDANFDWYWAVDNFSVTEVLCNASTGLASYAIGTDSISINWTSNGGVTFGIEYGAQGFTPGIGSGTLASTVDTFFTINNLSSNTVYDIYLTDTCTSGFGTTVGPITVTTLCNPVSAPFLEDFEDASSTRSCWANDIITSNHVWTYATGSSGGSVTAAFSGNLNARFTSSSGSHTTRLVSPMIDVSSLNTPHLRFRYAQEDWAGDQNELRIYVRDHNSSSWSLVFTDVNDVPAWTLGEVTLLTNTDTIQVAFEATDLYGRANVLDDVEIVEAPACPDPIHDSIVNIQTTSADIHWTGASSLSNLAWGPQGFSQGTPTANLRGVTSPYSLTTLAPDSCYDIYIQDSCSNGNSGWIGPFTFCTPPTCPAPTGLDVINGSVTINSADVYWTTGGANDWNVSVGAPGFNPNSGTITNAINDTVTVSSLTPGTDYELYVRDSCAAGDVSVWVGPISFTTPPTCPAPTALGDIPTQVTLTTADIYWTTGGASDWNIQFGGTGFALGSGTIVNSTNDTLTLTNLSAGTAYHFYVRDSCGAGDVSVWSGPYEFYTAFSTNYLEDFSQNSPPAWTEADGLLTTNTVFTSNSSNWTNDIFGNVGSNSQKSNIYTDGQYEWMISPSIYLDPTLTLQVNFDAAITVWNQTTQATLGSDDTLALVISTDNGATWSKNNIIRVFTASSTVPATGQQYIDALSAYSGYVRFGFYASGSSTNDPEDNDLFIDNFEVRTPPTCANPANIVLHNITTDSALVSWDAGDPAAIDWDVIYTIGNQPASSGTVVTSLNDSLQLFGLTQNTQYCVYVVEQCALGYSDTIGPICFGTQCLTQSLPYSENWNNGGFGCFYPTDSGSTTHTWQNAPAGGTSNTSGDLDGSPYMLVDSDEAGSGSTMNEYLTSPVIDAGSVTGLLILEFDQYLNHLDVEIADVDVYDGTQWVNILRQTTDVGSFANPDHQYIDVTAYANANFQVRFHYYDATFDWYWAVDNFNLWELLCAPPTNLDTTNVTCDSIDVMWTSTSNTSSSHLEYGPSGFVPGTGAGTVVNNVTSPYTINSLTPGATYDFYVVDSCGVNISDTTGPFTFKMDTIPTITASFTYIQSDTTGVDATVDFDASGSVGATSYSWDFGNTGTGTNVNESSTYTSNGNYNVVLTITGDCGATDDTTITITIGGISVIENTIGARVDLYPNPSNGNFNLSVDQATSLYEVEVTDLSGKVILRKEGLEPGLTHPLEIRESAGLYMLTIRGKGLHIVRRLIIE